MTIVFANGCAPSFILCYVHIETSDLGKYGKSEPGKLLNLMQLACPFCRRKPTVKTLARYNPRATTLGGLQQAMDDRRFFYAWCITCGFAKQSYERVCCNEERLPMVENFRCRDCTPDRSPRVNPIGRVTDCPTCGVAVEKVWRHFATYRIILTIFLPD
jgi:hypothetical protein